jgi:hypothetical protein
MRKAIELPFRFFPGGYLRGWSEPDRTTILVECDKDFKFNRDVRNELRAKWDWEVVRQLMKGYACVTTGNTLNVDFPTKDLGPWLAWFEEVCERSEPPLLRPRRRLAKCR